MPHGGEGIYGGGRISGEENFSLQPQTILDRGQVVEDPKVLVGREGDHDGSLWAVRDLDVTSLDTHGTTAVWPQGRRAVPGTDQGRALGTADPLAPQRGTVGDVAVPGTARQTLTAGAYVPPRIEHVTIAEGGLGE